LKTSQDGFWSADLALLLAAQACFGYAFSTFYLIPKFVTEALGAGPVEVGLVTTAHGAAAVVALLAAGICVDRFGRTPFLTGGALLMAVTCFALIAVEDVGALLYGLRIIQGVAFAFAVSAGATLCVDLAPPNRTAQAIGFFGVTMLGMNAAAATFGELLAEWYGWGATFGAAALGALLCALLSLRMSEPVQLPGPPRDASGFLRVMTRPALRPIFAVITVVGAAFGAMTTFQIPFALELGMDRVGGYFIAYASAAVAVRLLLGTFVDGWGHRRVALVNLLLYAVSVFAMAALQPATLVPLGALFGVAHGLFYPSFSAVAIGTAESRDRGKVIAFFQAWFSVGVAVGCFLLGYLADARGYPAVFVATGVATLLGWLVLLIRIHPDRPT
jgi:predicted MFS family arabinose efflux permease